MFSSIFPHSQWCQQWLDLNPKIFVIPAPLALIEYDLSFSLLSFELGAILDWI
jgi:hypothetical protein